MFFEKKQLFYKWRISQLACHVKPTYSLPKCKMYFSWSKMVMLWGFLRTVYICHTCVLLGGDGALRFLIYYIWMNYGGSSEISFLLLLNGLWFQSENAFNFLSVYSFLDKKFNYVWVRDRNCRASVWCNSRFAPYWEVNWSKIRYLFNI